MSTKPEQMKQKNIPDIPVLNGLSEIIDDYDAFIFDIYGVIHDGIRLYEHTITCLRKLREAGKDICLLSNTPRRCHEIESDLSQINLPRDLYDHVVTAGDSAHDAVKARAGQKCWYAGTHRFEALLDGVTLEIFDTPDNADFILNAISSSYPLSPDEIYTALSKALDMKLPMICANPDLIVNIGDQTHICAGTYADWYLEQGGTVSYHGKPHAPVYDMVWEMMGKPDKTRTIAIGDSLKTDIQGANDFGIDSIFNLIGIHWHNIKRSDASEKPDLEKLAQMIDNQPYKPSSILCGLSWVI